MDCNCELCVHLRTASPKGKAADLSPEQVVADIGRKLEAAFVRMQEDAFLHGERRDRPAVGFLREDAG